MSSNDSLKVLTWVGVTTGFLVLFFLIGTAAFLYLKFFMQIWCEKKNKEEKDISMTLSNLSLATSKISETEY